MCTLYIFKVYCFFLKNTLVHFSGYAPYIIRQHPTKLKYTSSSKKCNEAEEYKGSFCKYKGIFLLCNWNGLKQNMCENDVI